MTPIERAARALAHAHGERAYNHGATTQSPDDYEAERWTNHLGDARNVLHALREPSERMVKAGGRSGLYAPLDQSTIAVWQAMIDAALEE